MVSSVESGNTPLHDAVAAGDKKQVEQLAREGGSNSKNAEGKTPDELATDPAIKDALRGVILDGQEQNTNPAANWQLSLLTQKRQLDDSFPLPSFTPRKN